MAQAAWESEFAEYFAARAGQLRRLAYGLCGDWHLAEDLVQATFVKLYRHWDRARSQTLDAYTRRILINTFLSGRRSGRHEHVTADLPDRAGPLGYDPATSIDLGRALAALPPRQRALVVVRFLEDISIAETAEMFGITEGTVKSQTSRGIQTLRAALAEPAVPRE